MTYGLDERAPPQKCDHCHGVTPRPCGRISRNQCSNYRTRERSVAAAVDQAEMEERGQIGTATHAELDAFALAPVTHDQDHNPIPRPEDHAQQEATMFYPTPAVRACAASIINEAMNDGRQNHSFTAEHTEGWRKAHIKGVAEVIALVAEEAAAALEPVPATRPDPFIWRHPAAAEDALIMERAAWEKADIERTMLRVRVANLRQALVQCAWAAGMEGIDPNVSDALLVMEVPEAFADRVSKRDTRIAELEARVARVEADNRTLEQDRDTVAARLHVVAAEAERRAALVEQSLGLVNRMTPMLEWAAARIEQLEAERRTPITARELQRVARLVGGWRGSWLGDHFRLVDALHQRRINFESNGPARAALAEIDRLRSVRGAIYGTWDEAFRAGAAHARGQGSFRGPVADEQVYTSYAHSRTFRGNAVSQIDDALADRKLKDQP